MIDLHTCSAIIDNEILEEFEIKTPTNSKGGRPQKHYKMSYTSRKNNGVEKGKSFHLENSNNKKAEQQVRKVINYLSTRKGTVTRNHLAATLRIDSITAEKWLELIHDIKHNCPDFDLEKIGRFTLINISSSDSVQSEPMKAKERTDIFMRKPENTGEFIKEFDGRLSEGIKGLEPVKTRIAQTDRKAVMYCDKCGSEEGLPVHCANVMSFERMQFVCNHCGEQAPVPTCCGELKKIMIK
ncbi:MAG: hypothetical protein ACTSP4_01595 [Candidatus Hodarchaeales archaeon]